MLHVFQMLVDGRMSRIALLFIKLALRCGAFGKRLVEHLVAQAEQSEATAVLILAYGTMLNAGAGDAQVMRRLADLSLRSGDVVGANSLYTKLNSMGVERSTKLYKNALMNEALAKQGEPYIACLWSVIVDGTYGCVYDGDKVYVRELSDMNLGKLPYVANRVSPGFTHFACSVPEPVRTIRDPCLLLGVDGRNFAHWLSRRLLSLYLLEQKNVPASMPILINSDIRPYQYEYLDLLEISRSRLIPVEAYSTVQCAQLHVPITFRRHPKMRVAIDWLRGRLAKYMVPPKQATEKLYISRLDAKQRILLNEAELEQRLVSLGFRPVVLDGMKVIDQIRTLSSASIIVGPHGAGLSNIMFAPTTATVVEITNTKVAHMLDFRAIAEQLNQRYIDIVSGWFPDSQDPALGQQADYLVDVEDVVLALQDAELV